jgi:hypothetical protein
VSNSERLSKERAVAGAGIAALALLRQLTDVLMSSRRLSADELREALDAALLSLEKAQGDSPVPEASDCARRCLEQFLACAGEPTAASGEPGQKSSR